MKSLSKIATRMRRMFALTPEQAERLAQVKFPCC